MPIEASDLVSVVIPTHNRRARVAKAITSASAQTWTNIEIIVVDDASTDDTSEFLTDLAARDERVQVIRNSVAGGGALARNAGIAAARGTYIAFLDDDDQWLPNKLALQVSELQATQGAVAASCSFLIAPESGTEEIKVLRAVTDSQEIIYANCLGGASMCLARREALEAIGGFDPSLPSCQDWDLWIKLVDAGPVVVCPMPLVRYLPHADVRISTNAMAVYVGRRRVFLRYRNRLNDETRFYHLEEILYCRKVQQKKRWTARTRGLISMLRLTGWRNWPRYSVRYLKQIHAELAQSIGMQK